MSTRLTTTERSQTTETQTMQTTRESPADAQLMFATDNERPIVGLFETERSDPLY